MRIESVLPEPYEVEDYEFLFANGLLMPYTVAKSIGDTIDFDTIPMAVKINFVEKPSVTDKDAMYPPEEITILMSHVIQVTKRRRFVTPPTKEQKDLFRQSFFKPPKTLQ